MRVLTHQPTTERGEGAAPASRRAFLQCKTTDWSVGSRDIEYSDSLARMEMSERSEWNPFGEGAERAVSACADHVDVSTVID